MGSSCFHRGLSFSKRTPPPTLPQFNNKETKTTQNMGACGEGRQEVGDSECTGRGGAGFHTELAHLLCPMRGEGRDRHMKGNQRWSQPSSTTAFWGSLSHTHRPPEALEKEGPRLGHVAVGVGWGQEKHTDARSKERSRRADWPPWLSPVRRSPDLQARSTSFSKSVCKTETEDEMRAGAGSRQCCELQGGRNGATKATPTPQRSQIC